MHWLESESSDGAVQVTEVIHLEYIKPLPPFVVLDAEDAFDFAPTSIFFRISFENGYITLYADCSAFGIEIGEHIDQTSKQAENKKRSAPPSNEVSGKTCKRTANDKRTALTTLISDALLPGEESKFLARKGTRHYARLCSAKVWEVCCIYQIQQKRFLGTVSRASPPNFNLFTTYLKSWLTSKNV